MSIEPGDAFAVKVNSHKHQWNGQVCSSPTHWRCGADDHFREVQCDRGTERCFHLKLFASNSPKLVIPDPSVVNFAAANPSFLDDQFLFFYGPNYDLKGGRPDKSNDHSLYGVYRVKRANLENTYGGKTNLIVEPYPDGWAMFPRNTVRRPPTPIALDGVAYLSRISARHASESIENAKELAEDMPASSSFSESMLQQLLHFHEKFDEWAEIASNHLGKHNFANTTRYHTEDASEQSSLAETLKAALRKGRSLGNSSKADLPQTTTKASVDELIESEPAEEEKVEPNISDNTESHTETIKSAAKWIRTTLPELECKERLASAYGERLLTALQIATLTKSLLILTGAPGVGKSWLASRLIEDECRERSEIVPVSSTWRGREDLLGYVNPVNGEFEPTSFTKFLRRCEQAWNAGDRRTWLVIFEEFNLSQPEHWLSDLLVRLEFDPERKIDRTISLGGTKVTGEVIGEIPEVFLPPNLMFVATLNNDHTVRPLSPRVLDRAALIEVSATGRAALQRVGLEVSNEVEEAVEELNDLLEARGVAFSVRSARSLKNANEFRGVDHVMSNLDHVLAQEVLSKVRLMAGDPRDETLLARLKDWGNRPASSDLMLCRERLALWDEALQAGRDIFQA